MRSLLTNVGAMVALASMQSRQMAIVEPPQDPFPTLHALDPEINAAAVAQDKVCVERQHADLTKKTINVPESVQAAARAVYEAGGSPRQQLVAARDRIGHNRLTYTPHTGAKQRAKALRRK